jgi:hypothetical protein
MPNGDSPDFINELPLLIRFFSNISKELEHFALERNLDISKYYHESPSWHFNFRHPMCGEGSLGVERINDSLIKLHQSWSYDDYEKGTRSIKWTSSDEIELDKEELKGILNQKLDEILGWNFGDWDKVVSGYEKNWRTHWTKEDFERQLEAMPYPKANDGIDQ